MRSERSSQLALSNVIARFQPSNLFDDSLQLLERRIKLLTQNRCFRIQDPIVFPYQLGQQRFVCPERLSQQTLRAITLHCLAEGFLRSRHSEAMIQFLIFNNKRGDEYAFIPLAVPIDVLEFFTITQILPHASTEA